MAIVSEQPRSLLTATTHTIKKGWTALDRGILSIPTPPSSQTSEAKRTSIQRKRKPPAATNSDGQSRLQEFGFLEKPIEQKPALEVEWSDEEELVFPIIDAKDQGARGDGDVKAVEEKMGPVPEPPWHPSLRPAGIREMQRRQREDARLEREVAEEMDDPPPFPCGSRSDTDTPSSLTTDPLSVSTSTKEWWDNLGQRRSSEFASSA